LSRTTQVSWYQKGKSYGDFTQARDSQWHRHQLGHVQVCTSLQTDNHASTQPLSFFTGWMPFLPPNQQRQSTEGNLVLDTNSIFVLQEFYYTQIQILNNHFTSTTGTTLGVKQKVVVLQNSGVVSLGLMAEAVPLPRFPSG